MGVLTPLFHPLICKCANAGGSADRQNRAKTDQDLLPERDKEAAEVFKAQDTSQVTALEVGESCILYLWPDFCEEN